LEPLKIKKFGFRIYFINLNFLDMKKIFYIASGLFIAFTSLQSCEKEQLNNQSNDHLDSSVTIKSDDEESFEPERIIKTFYSNMNRVDSSEIDFTDLELLVHVNTSIDSEDSTVGIMDVYTFTNQESWLEFGTENNFQFAEILEFEGIIDEYLSQNPHVEDYYDSRGLVDRDFSDFKDSVEVDIWGQYPKFATVIWDEIWGGSAWVIPTSWAYVMPPGWNNRTSRFMNVSLYGLVAGYDRWRYQNRMFTWYGWGWTTIRLTNVGYYPFGYFNNRMSSMIRF
jgi:hypothetical protein